MPDADPSALLRKLPSVDEVLGREAVRALLEGHPRPAVVRAVRAAVDAARKRILRGEASPEVPDEAVAAALACGAAPGLVRVINGTGVVLHTNLGRAPLAAEACEAVARIAAGYANLELDLGRGERGSRHAPLEPLLAELTGAEAALAVNNNAAAVWLVLAALAEGKSCVVSRGELVEIGGGFRIPDVMRQSGARLVEVGTTNRTRLSDYADAIGSDTALLVKVHRSNFRQVGFTEEVSTAELARLGRERGVAVYEDLGSGCLVPLRGEGLVPEPTVRETVAAGADVVTFSGDKLLGGPQAGLVVGRKALVEPLRKHPLHRAVRVDKLAVAALEATLRLYRDGREAEVPAVRLLAASRAQLRPRAERLRELVGGDAEVVEVTSQPGGGSLPGAEPPSLAVALGGDAAALAAALRTGEPPVVARVHGERLHLDVRTIFDDELPALAAAVDAARRRVAAKGRTEAC